MWKISIAVVATISLGACAPKSRSDGQPPTPQGDASAALDNDTAIKILMPYEHMACDRVTFSVGGGINGGQYATSTVALYQWIVATFRNTAIYRPTYGDQMEKDYVYTSNGYSYRIKYVDFMHNPSVETQSFEITTCPVVADQINIEDKTPDASNPKLATVTYTVTTKQTLFGSIIASMLGPTRSDVMVNSVSWSDDVVSPTTKEYQATLQRYDVGGWRLATGHKPLYGPADIWVNPVPS